MITRRTLALASTAAIIAAGCGVAAIGTGVASAASDQAYKVDVDGVNPDVNESFEAFFPSEIKVHPGDTIDFHWTGNGDPHTVTLGTLADAAVAAFDKLGPNFAGKPPQSALDADAKVPQLLPQGPGDAIQAAANPCFLASGAPPEKGACSKVDQPDFTGTQSFYNSGWLSVDKGGDVFKVHLSPTIAPGTYRYMCLLHREGMSGRVVVVPKDQPVPSPAEQVAAGRAQLAKMEKQLAPAVVPLRQGKLPGVTLAGPNTVLAGSGTKDSMDGMVDEFGPKNISIPVGGAVTFNLVGVHTIAFGTTPDVNSDPRHVAPDGTVHLVADAVAPHGGPGQPQQSDESGMAGGSGPPPPAKVVASATWDGTGLLNSGVFFSDPGSGVQAYKVTFTKAGVYTYLCTIHDEMKGTVTVGAATGSGDHGGTGTDMADSTGGTTSPGQVSVVPSGGALTGGGSTATSTDAGLISLGLAMTGAGAVLVAGPMATRRRRGRS